ncbi:MAG: S9 family peptidase [Gemmatimonadetes bacterium]|nr:MAG: hypothetical protein DMD67_00615 [Gemmatimonadota bacterium]TLY56662.1 MAG: S9 family peptidase [Gemmatimonadota bacterium]
MQPRPLLILGLSLGLAASAAAQGKRLELSDLQRLVNVTDPALSPDGKTVACVVSRVNWSDDRFDQELVLVEVATGAQRQLTFDRKGVGSPQWSAAGDRLAFLATAGSGDKAAAQVFVLDMHGGEARKVTDASSGVEQFVWKPDGTEIAYVAADEPENKKDIEAHNDAFEVGDDGYLTTAAPTPSHIWVVSADSGAARRLTHGPWSLAKSQPPGPPSSPLSWSPDGKALLFTEQATPHFGDADQTRVMVLDVASGATRPLTTHKALEGYGSYSPDGSRIAYWYPRDGDLNNVNEIFVTSAAGGPGLDATRALDRNLQRAIWMPDGRSLLVGGHDGTRTALWLQPLDGAAKRIELGDVSPSWSFWLDASVDRNGAIAFTGSSPGRPTELYYLATPGATLRRLTDLNGEIAERQLGTVERFEWQGGGPDGYREDGVVTYPPGFTKGRTYPLVLVIHGGPTAASVRGFTFLSQLLAAHDYVVFSPNYRGSDNLGNAYQRAIFNDAGDGPGRDVMAGIAALAKRGGVDTTRIGVSGWSYGGYMTTWLIGHYRIWKAAVAGAAVTNIVDQYDMADYNVQGRYGFVGFSSPWTGKSLDAYRDQSPISYVAAMKTPTLILSDVRDPRVTVSQSYELYHALRDNGVRVKFVAYPVDGHFPVDPVRTTDVYRRWLEWLDQYLKGPVSAR